MRAFRITVLATVVSCGAATAVVAQPTETVSGMTLKLAEAVEQALARNRDLAVSRREIDVSRGRLLQARRYPFNPELAIEGEGGRGVGRAEPDRRGIGGGKIGVAQVVEIRGQRGLRVRGAEADMARTEWAAREAERDVVAEVMKTFS